jgi:hypothetical protein
MDEVNRAAKKTLWQFKPTFQEYYIMLQQLDSLVETKCNSLLDTKPEVPDINVAQEFFAGTLILARKCQDWVAHYNSFCKQSLAIVPKLGPSFEGDHNKPTNF